MCARGVGAAIAAGLLLASACATGPTPTGELLRKPVPPAGLDDALTAHYPSKERREGTPGEAVLRIVIGPDGRTLNHRILRATNPRFAEACIRMLAESRWEPGIGHDGEPVGTQVKYNCRFVVAPLEPPRAAADASRQPSSSFEARWLTACGASGLVGGCPPPSKTLYFDVEDTGPFRPDACPSMEEAAGRRLHAALAQARAELVDCLRGADAEAWAGVVPATGLHSRWSGVTEEAARCIAARVTAAASSMEPGYVEQVLVTRGRSGTLAQSGTVSEEQITRVIQEHAGELRACYDAARVVWPGLEGETDVLLSIAPDGSVAFAHTQGSSLGNPALECCLNTVMRGLRFEASSGGSGAMVLVPLAFREPP